MTELFKITNKKTGDVAYSACPAWHASEFMELISSLYLDLDIARYQENEMKLTELPVETQDEVRDVLKAFDNVNVAYYNNKFNVSTGVALYAKYPDGYFLAGRYRADEVFTPDERKQNYIESFGV